MERVKVTEVEFGAATLKVREGLRKGDLPFVPRWDELRQLDLRQLEEVALCVEMDLPCLLVGPTGCGKTTGIELLGALVNQPVRRMNLNGDVRSSSFLGEKVLDVDPVSGQAVTRWKDGLLPDAMRRGHWVILDEFDGCPASLGMVVQSVLEPGHQLTLADNHGEVVDPDPFFRIFATANTLGRGDDSGLYEGTNVMNEATLDRFTVVECGYLPPSDEAALLVMKAGVTLGAAEGMARVAEMVREGFTKGECSCTLSTRRLLTWAMMTRRFSEKSPTLSVHATVDPVGRGYELAVGSKLSKEDRKYLAGIVQRVMGVVVRKG